MAATQASTSAAPIDTAPVSASPVAQAGSDATPSTVAAPSGVPKPKSSLPQATTLPLRDKESLNKLVLERYITRDWIQTAALKQAQDQRQREFVHQRNKVTDYKNVRTEWRHIFPPSSLYGEGYKDHANGYTETGPGPSKIVYPQQKPRPGRRSTPPLKYTRKDMAKQAEADEELVPVRLDVEWDKIKLRDTFTWNLHERIVTPELFAAQLVEDMGVDPHLAKTIYEHTLHQLKEQINDFFPFAYSDEDALDPELPYSAYKNDEMRILIKLNITIGQHTLVDQFEWELNNPMNSPEEFAESLSRDMSLSGEFTTAIAHCIREQAQLFTRSMYSVGHPFDGRPIEDQDLQAAFLPSPLLSVFRPQQAAKEYAPFLYELSEAEIERNETIFSREQRRQKRSVNRRGGPSLPDLRERQRTIRTLVLSSVVPGAARKLEDTKLYKRTMGLTAASGRPRRGVRDGEISFSDESDGSGPDSPAISHLQGTARTRGMRGAASAAQQRMANLGRSETPEAIHSHETRTNRGRSGYDDEPQPRIVTLKVSPEKLRKLLEDMKSKHPTSSGPTPSGSATPSGQNHQKTPSASASMPPPTTPSTSNQNLPPKTTTPAGQFGRLPAPPPPRPGEKAPTPPPTPDWLDACIKKLLEAYPKDSFEAIMRYCAVNTDTDQPVAAPPPDRPTPPNIAYMYLPRIRCHDCPGKLYTPGPEMTANNFEVHLKNRAHRDRVHARRAKIKKEDGGEGRAASASSSGVRSPPPSASTA